MPFLLSLGSGLGALFVLALFAPSGANEWRELAELPEPLREKVKAIALQGDKKTVMLAQQELRLLGYHCAARLLCGKMNCEKGG